MYYFISIYGLMSRKLGCPEHILRLVSQNSDSCPAGVPPRAERCNSVYVSDFEVPGFLFKSLRSLLRPNACLLATRSSREMKCTGMPKKVLATLFLHAPENLTPVISVRTSMRTGAIPI